MFHSQGESKKENAVLAVILVLVGWWAYGQTPQGVYLHQLSNGEFVEVYAEEGVRLNGRLVSNVSTSAMTCDGGGGPSDMAIAPVVVLDATNTTPVVITATAHEYVDGDYVWLDDIGGNLAANGYRRVKNPTANTFEITDYGGEEIAGNGTYTAGGEGFLSFVFDPGNRRAVIKRLTGYAHAASYDSEKYLAIDELPNGIALEVRNNTSNVLVVTGDMPVKIWLDWALHAGVDITNSDGGLGVKMQTVLRWDFTKGFGPIRVDGALNQVLVLVIRDDLSALIGQKMSIQGFFR